MTTVLALVWLVLLMWAGYRWWARRRASPGRAADRWHDALRGLARATDAARRSGAPWLGVRRRAGLGARQAAKRGKPPGNDRRAA